MTADDFRVHLEDIGLNVEIIRGADKQDYLCVRDFAIPTGPLKGKICDIAILKNSAVPYLPPAVIHTKPPLVRMHMSDPLKTQESTSQIGPGWQYWSRRLDAGKTPSGLWALILTVLTEAFLEGYAL